VANNKLFGDLKKAILDPLKKFSDNLNKQLNRGTLRELADETRAQIRRGISPVDGVGKFQKYSESYLDAIKNKSGDAAKKNGKRSPVDMTLSGDMLKSLDIVEKSGSTFMEFEDTKAYFHNNSGAGKSRKIRRLLPDATGEKFNQVLQNKFYGIVRRIVKKTRIKN
jgi:hypothetical protein